MLYITVGDNLEARKKNGGTRKVFYSVPGCYSGRLTNRSVNFVFFVDLRIAVQVRLKTKLSLLVRFFLEVAFRMRCIKKDFIAKTISSVNEKFMLSDF